MTLVVALACKNGVVFASESQSTTNITQGIALKHETIKIKPLGNNKLWAASGTESIIQKIEQSFNVLQITHPNFLFSNDVAMKDYIDEYMKIIKDSVDTHKIAWSGISEGAKPPIPVASPIIVGYEDATPKIWHIDPSGSHMFWEKKGALAIGNGNIFATPMLKRFNTLEYDIEVGSLIALKVLTEAIDISGYGIGGPIDIWTIDRKGPHRKGEEEFKGLEEAYGGWQRIEEEIFEIQIIKNLNESSS